MIFFVFLFELIICMFYIRFCSLAMMFCKHQSDQFGVKILNQFKTELGVSTLFAFILSIVYIISNRQQNSLKENYNSIDCSINDETSVNNPCDLIKANNIYLNEGHFLTLIFLIGHSIIYYAVYRLSLRQARLLGLRININ